MRASLFTLRRLYYRSIAFSPLQVNVARTIGILPNDRLDFWCGLRTIGSKFKFPHLTQTKTLSHYNYRSFLCESRVVYFWKFRSHSGQYTVRLINTCNIHSQVWQESKRYFTNSWDQDYSYFSFFSLRGYIKLYIYLFTSSWRGHLKKRAKKRSTKRSVVRLFLASKIYDNNKKPTAKQHWQI